MNPDSHPSHPRLTAVGYVGIFVGLLIFAGGVLAMRTTTDPNAAGGIAFLLFGGVAFICLSFVGCRRN
jgi:hypothetical protein